FEVRQSRIAIRQPSPDPRSNPRPYRSQSIIPHQPDMLRAKLKPFLDMSLVDPSASNQPAKLHRLHIERMSASGLALVNQIIARIVECALRITLNARLIHGLTVTCPAWSVRRDR